MPNDDSNGQTESEAPAPYPGLRPLERLIGTWKISGEAEGETTYEWMEGGFFLIGRGTLKQAGTEYKHLEIIGSAYPLCSVRRFRGYARQASSSGNRRWNSITERGKSGRDIQRRYDPARTELTG